MQIALQQRPHGLRPTWPPRQKAAGAATGCNDSAFIYIHFWILFCSLFNSPITVPFLVGIAFSMSIKTVFYCWHLSALHLCVFITCTKEYMTNKLIQIYSLNWTFG